MNATKTKTNTHLIWAALIWFISLTALILGTHEIQFFASFAAMISAAYLFINVFTDPVK